MVFSGKTEVFYKGMYGVIDFVCDSYVVVEVPPKSNHTNAARLVVFEESYKDIQIKKASGK